MAGAPQLSSDDRQRIRERRPRFDVPGRRTEPAGFGLEQGVRPEGDKGVQSE